MTLPFRTLPFRTLRLSLLCVFCALAAGSTLRAQERDEALSQREVEKLRDAAYVPLDRVKAFEDILDARARSIEDLVSKPRHPGRESDLHDLLSQFGDIAGEFDDNLDDLAGKHRDLRKALPKLLEATDRWATTLRAPADDPAYRVARRIALDAVADLKQSAQTMLDEQTAYFKAHPEAEKIEKQRNDPRALPEPIEIPR